MAPLTSAFMKTLALTSLFPALLSAGALAAEPAARPATLLALAGAASQPGRLSASVVLIIDAQHDYTETGKLRLAGIADALHQTARLLQRARATHVPVIHIQQLSPPGRGVFEIGTPAVAFAPEAAPVAGETILTKALPNAFAGTSLDAALRQLGRRELIISGYMTHMCVSATARSALDHGYHVTVIADACATRDLPGVDGEPIRAADVHRIALAELADRFATVVPTLDQIAD